MPTYQYKHTITGQLRDEIRPVDERDFPLPDGPWERITVPSRIAITGSAQGLGNQTLEEGMRQAYYKYEQGGHLDEHFSKQEIADAKRVWLEEPAGGYKDEPAPE